MVKVTWFDATFDDAPDEPAWKDMAESVKRDPAEIITVGFLLARSATHLTLCQSIAQDEQTAGRFMIPACFIKSLDTI